MGWYLGYVYNFEGEEGLLVFLDCVVYEFGYGGGGGEGVEYGF